MTRERERKFLELPSYVSLIANLRIAGMLAGVLLHSVASAADVVPLTFVNSLPFVTVKIGAATTRLMVDSGGSLGMSIPTETIEESGSVTLLDQKTRFRDLQGQVYEVLNLVAKQVSIGNTELGPTEGQVHVQWGGAPEGPDAELTKARQAGAIGLAAFGNRPILLDYRQGTLLIYGPGDAPPTTQQDWRTLRLESGKIGPNITVNVDGKPLRFVLDTGAQINLINEKSLASTTADSACHRPTSGGEQCDPRALGMVLDSNGHSLGPIMAQRVDLNGAPFDGILGAPFFQSRKVLFDLASGRLLISSADAHGTVSN